MRKPGYREGGVVSYLRPGELPCYIIIINNNNTIAELTKIGSEDQEKNNMAETIFSSPKHGLHRVNKSLK